MEEFYKNITARIKNMVSNNRRPDWEGFRDEFCREVKNCLSGGSSFVFTHKIDDFPENYQYYHIVNIALISARIAKELGFADTQECNLLTMCIFHNREIFKLPDDFINSLYRDEKEAADIIQVADVFDTTINPPAYRKQALAWSAPDALEKIMQINGSVFNPAVVAAFLKAITVFPVGTKVVLNNDLIGVVKATNRNHFLRPQIEIISDKSGKQYDQSRVIDLAKEKLLYIKEVLK
ncbi:MAG: hypothetical protein ABIH01_03070 [Candidatus Omnitrophota bacterium]